MSPWKHIPRGLWGRVTSETPKPSTTLGNAAHQPCSPRVGERTLKPFEGFPQLSKEQISLISFCPKEICSPSTQTFGKKKEKSPRCAGCKNLIWGHCCWLGASPQPLAMQCQVPVRKGFFPSQPHQAQGKEKAAGCSSQCCGTLSHRLLHEGWCLWAQEALPMLPDRPWGVLTPSG